MFIVDKRSNTRMLMGAAVKGKNENVYVDVLVANKLEIN